MQGLIDNVQASWVKLGLDGGQRLLDAGCNDLGGTLMDEIISRSAGASHGTFVEAADFEAAILAVGRVPQQRTTLYEPVRARAPR
jgi:FO synthase